MGLLKYAAVASDTKVLLEKTLEGSGFDALCKKILESDRVPSHNSKISFACGE